MEMKISFNKDDPNAYVYAP